MNHGDTEPQRNTKKLCGSPASLCVGGLYIFFLISSQQQPNKSLTFYTRIFVKQDLSFAIHSLPMTKIIFFIAFIVATIAVTAQSNEELAALLDAIYQKDQSVRLKIDSLQKQFGWKSEQVQSLLKTMGIQDSINLIKIKNIIDTHGWLGPDDVGKQGSQTIFLVIQHADSLTQVTYFPIMKEAVKKGKARPQDLALLEDRILTNQGKEQEYGSQVRTNEAGKYEFFPIKDEPNVNKRRASVGLQPLEEYAKFFDIKYVLPKSKGN